MIMLNQRAWNLAQMMIANAEMYQVRLSSAAEVCLVDCSEGGLETGLLLARICLSDMADVRLVTNNSVHSITVSSDHPVNACLASQYAGWQIKSEQYFAMASGPFRAKLAKEDLFRHLLHKETSDRAVAIFESPKLPTPDIVADLMKQLDLGASQFVIFTAPAASLPGTIQVVARSVETALHKLHTLNFDLSTIRSAAGSAPLPPVGVNELQAIGWTNDAILYGGSATFWLRCSDEAIETIGPQVPSCSSKDYGSYFAELYKRYGNFYEIDPLLFSPAQVTFHNMQTGRSFCFGRINHELLSQSFGMVLR